MGTTLYNKEGKFYFALIYFGKRKGVNQLMKKRFLASMTLVGIMDIGGLFSNCQAQVMTGGHKPGKAIWGDYWGMA